MRRLFLLVAAVVLVDTMFYAAITPLLPQYADELGLSKTAAGVLSAAYPAGTLIGTFPAAWMAARLGVKPTLLAGLALIATAGTTFAFAEHIVLLDAARFLQGVGGACAWVGGFSWLIAVAPAERRGEVIGSGLAAAIFGFLLGPVLGGAATVTSPELVFSLAASVAVVLGAITLGMEAVAPSPFPGWRRVGGMLTSLPIAAGVWLTALPAIFSGTINVLAPLRLDRLGATGVFVAGVFLVSALIEGAASPSFGRLSDRRGRLWPIRIGLVVAAAMAIWLPIPDAIVVLGISVVVAEVSLGLCWTPAMAMLSDSVERLQVGQWLAFGLVNLAWASGMVLGGSGGGALADRTSDTLPLALAAVLLALTAAAITFSGRLPAAAEKPVARSV
jgi:MFS family permease